MRYKSPPPSFFAHNRQTFAARMAPRSAAIFHANDQYTHNGDAGYRFIQNHNLYYLSGLDQEEIILVLFPDAPDPRFQEMLFVREQSEHLLIWEGKKYTHEEAKSLSGVEQVYDYGEFENQMRRLLYHIDGFYFDINERDPGRPATRSAAHRLAQQWQQAFPTHQLLRASPILEDLRMIKAEAELVQMREAIRITGEAFERVLAFVAPGRYEYEVEAEISHEYLRQGADGHAFDPIVAGGKNACILHYVRNRDPLQDGELLLLDTGASYGHYSADMSRTFPINGQFSDRQRSCYEAVLRVLKAARSQLVVGNTLKDYQRFVGQSFTEELLGLGLLKKEDVAAEDPEDPKAYLRYSLHGVSHFLGLDTHDVGNRYAPFQAGMVFTCEPGIYIPDEGIGIRLENDVLLSDAGPVDLMAQVPIEVEEIEAKMQP